MRESDVIMTSAANRLSLCICTMNRPRELAGCLASLFSGSALPTEVLVSDDSDDQSAQSVAEQFGVKYQVGPRRGLGPNRNACIDAVQGSHIVFIDDDVIVPPEFVERAGNAACDDVVTGYEMLHRGGLYKVVPQNANFWGFQSSPVKNGDYTCIVMNATVFPARLFHYARFNELTRYGYEEIDMARQARALGFRIRCDSRLWVEHHPSPINRQEYRVSLSASRLYLTFRAYWRYDRHIPKAVAYAIAAPVHEMLSAVRTGAGVSRTARTIRSAAKNIRADAIAEGYAPGWSATRPGARSR